MGMFDTIYVESKLLHDYGMICMGCAYEHIEFQTKDLDSVLEYYYLHYVDDKAYLHFMKSDANGTMFNPGDGKAFTPITVEPEWPHQWVSIYSSCPKCNQWNEYKLKFTDGVLQTAKRVDLVRIKV